MAQGNPNPSPDTRFKPGHKMSGGGRPRKLLKRIDEVLHARGIDPVEEILKLLENTSITSTTKLKTWIEILPYVHAKVKEQATPADVVREDLAALSDGELISRLEKDLQTLKSA